MDGQPLAVLYAARASLVFIVDMLLPDIVKVYVDHVFPADGYGLVRLALVTYSLREKPVQNSHVDMVRSELGAEMSQLPSVDPVPELVQFVEASVAQDYSEVFPAQVPPSWYIQRRIPIEAPDAGKGQAVRVDRSVSFLPPHTRKRLKEA